MCTAKIHNNEEIYTRIKEIDHSDGDKMFFMTYTKVL